MNRKITETSLRLALCLSTLTAPVAAWAHGPQGHGRGDDSKRPSKNGLFKGKIAGADIAIHYGRPKVKGRQVWGKLVTMGKIWRTGSDEATTFHTSKAIKVGGKTLPAGTYALFSIPNKDKWTFIFNRNPKQWGAYKYNAKLDALRVDTQAKVVDKNVEELTFTASGEGIVLHWEKIQVPLTIEG